MEKHGMQYKMLSARQARCNANRCDHCSDCPFRDRINPTILIAGSYQKITIFLHVPNKERFITELFKRLNAVNLSLANKNQKFESCRGHGHHVIVDNFTNEVIQISNRNVNASDWIPDEGIIDPFIPRQ